MTNNIFLISVVAALSVVVIVVMGYFLGGVGDCYDFHQGEVRTPTTHISVAVAKTDIESSRGLSGCKNLPDKTGMYFPFKEKTSTAFWMKGMLIPIDIVWIRDNKVVGTNLSVPPPTRNLSEELPRYNPPQLIDAVLEVGAGKAQEYGLKEGVEVHFAEKE